MNLRKKSLLMIPLMVSIVFLVSGCAGALKLNSSWQSDEIKIDGDVSEWSTNIQPVPDKKVSVGFRNDDKFLYISLASEDRSKIMMITRAGLIIWFQPESGDKNKFGIRYPIATEVLPIGSAQGIRRDGGEESNMDKMFARILGQQTEFQIINKDKFPLTVLPLVNNEGIRAKLGFHSNQFVYELKVPLAGTSNYSYAVDVRPGGKLNIKFETEELSREAMRSAGGGGAPDEGGMSPGGSRGGRGGGGSRGGGGRSGGGGRAPGMDGGVMFEPLNFTVELNLDASSPKK